MLSINSTASAIESGETFRPIALGEPLPRIKSLSNRSVSDFNPLPPIVAGEKLMSAEEL